MTSRAGGDGDSGVSVWVLVAVVVAVIVLVAAALYLAFRASPDDSPGAEPTTSAPRQSTSSTSVATTTSHDQTTTTFSSTTTTVATADADNPFVGWWKSTDTDGRSVDLRVDVGGEVSFWDSASALCANDGVNSPFMLDGFSTFDSFGTPTLAVSGYGTCHLYGVGGRPTQDQLLAFYYDADGDTIESAQDGVRFERSPSVPGIPGDDSNPFVGSWEGTDSDLTHVEMMIFADGSWRSADTRSGGCEGKGFTYATWSADGNGTFDLVGIPTFDLSLTSYCHPVGEERLVHTPDVTFTLFHDSTTDTLELDGAEVEYTRLP